MNRLALSAICALGIAAVVSLATPMLAVSQEMAADAVWPHVWPKPSPATERIEKALETPVNLECVATPLSDVIEQLLGPQDIAYRFDAQAIQAAGFTDELRLTHRFADLSLASALSLVLGDVGMAYTIDNEALLISTPAGASRRASVKVYDVADLLRPTEAADQLASTLAASTEMRIPIYPPPPEAVAATLGEERRITAYQQMLIVRDTTPGHREFSKLLAALGRAYAEQNERLDALENVQEEATEQATPERPEAEAPAASEPPNDGDAGERVDDASAE
jgi:hypothetical protein